MPANRQIPITAVLAVLAAVAAGPFWGTYLTAGTSVLTVGRLALIIGGAFTFLAMLKVRPSLPGPMVLAGVGMLGLLIVAAISAATRGCNCDGALVGITEVFAMTAVCAALSLLWPNVRPAVLVAAATAGSVAGLLALAGVTDAHSLIGAPDSAFYGSRLGGTFQNPNFLALSVAVGIAAGTLALTRRRPRTMIAWCMLAGLLAYVVVETFSRSGVIAVAAGLATFLVASQPTVRRMMLACGALALAATIGIVVFSGSFESARTSADFGPEVERNAVDRSGWDASAQGPIPSGPSSLVNSLPGVLEVTPSESGEGVSHPLPAVHEGLLYVMTLSARTKDEVSADVRFRLQDNRVLGGGITRKEIVTPRWDEWTLRWTPKRDRSSPRIYVWQPDGNAAIEIRRITFRGPHADTTAISTQLRGSEDTAAAQEDRFIGSRSQGFELAGDAFLGQPILGIGWQTFPTYAMQNGDFGELATHNDYLRIAAELGVLGLIFLVVIIGSVVWGLTRMATTEFRAPIYATAVVGAVGLLFVNALAVPSIFAPFAAVIGISLSAARRRKV